MSAWWQSERSTTYGDAVHDDVAAVEGMDVKFGGVLEGDAFEEYVFAVEYAEEVVALLFLLFGGGGYVLIA